MIERGKWIVSDSELLGEISADAVTGNLRTQDNTLSMWEVADDPGEAVLALACGKQRLDTLDIVMLDKEAVQSRGLEVVEKLGETPVSELAKMGSRRAYLQVFGNRGFHGCGVDTNGAD